MPGMIARRWRWMALTVAGCLLVMVLPAAVAANVKPVRFTSLTIGPITTADGYKLSISAVCNGRPEYGYVLATRSGPGYSLGQEFSDFHRHATSCWISRRFGRASLTMRWGNLVRVRLDIAHAGRFRRNPAPRGCRSLGRYRPAIGTGTVRLLLHPKAFGRILLHTVRAHIGTTSGLITCAGGGSGRAPVMLFAHTTRAGDISASTNRRFGRRTIWLDRFTRLSRDVEGSMIDRFTGGSRLFSFRAGLTSATIGAGSDLLSGSLRYVATRACSAGATSGRLKGKLVVDDPVLGKVRFVGWTFREPWPSLQRLDGTC